MAEKRTDPSPGPVRFEIPDTMVHGVYCNRVSINVSGFDFTFDFGVAVPGAESIRVVARVLMSPQHAASLQDLLGGLLQQYVDEVGQVPEVSQDEEQMRRQIGFGPDADDNEDEGNGNGT